MLTTIQRLSVYMAIIMSFASCTAKDRESASEFISSVRNLTVQVFRNNQSDIDTYRSLKLNISWSAPTSNRQPSSYSVTVTSFPATNEGRSSSNCPEGSIYTILSNNRQLLNVSLPTHTLSTAIPELYIKRNCSYRVQVIANPRQKLGVNPTEVFYTVPECIGESCSCQSVESTLPTPKVNVIQKDNCLTINWSTSLKASDIRYYIISIARPLLKSTAGISVYNVTKIGQVPSEKTTFSWDLKSYYQYSNTKDELKIAVNAVNNQGCFGREGNSTVYLTSTFNRNWIVLIGIVTACILLGSISYVIRFVISYNSNSFHYRTETVWKCKSQWIEKALQNRNVLYIELESEEDVKGETDELEGPFKTVNVLHELGAGQFGKVYLGRLDDAKGTLVAVKMCPCTGSLIEIESRKEFMEEIRMMRMAGIHPHLVNLIGYCIQPDKPMCILIEYMAGGDLLSYLHTQREKHRINPNPQDGFGITKSLYRNLSSSRTDKRRLNESGHSVVRTYANITNDHVEKEINTTDISWFNKYERRKFLKFALEIAKGMEHLEMLGITHRDLAARNILLSADLVVKISDFGLSRNGVYVIENRKGKTRHLPIRWMSPEALRDRAFSSKSDVWSFGVVLWEIATFGSFPYSTVEDDRLYRYIIQENGRLEQPDIFPPDIYQVMCSCWATEPTDRPTFTRLLSELHILNLNAPSDSIRLASNPCYSLSL